MNFLALIESKCERKILLPNPSEAILQEFAEETFSNRQIFS